MDGAAYERIVMDTFEQLLADGESTGRVMSLPVHAFIIGQPHRIRYLRRVLETIAGSKDVWLTTSDQIADHFGAS
jgi:allantoinase